MSVPRSRSEYELSGQQSPGLKHICSEMSGLSKLVSVTPSGEGTAAQILNFSKEITMEEKCKSTIKGEVPVKNEELNAKTEAKDVLISDLKEEKIEEAESSCEFVDRSNPPHPKEDMAKEQKAEEGELVNYAEKETRNEDKEEITKDGEKVSNEEKKECHDESSDKLEEHEETKKEEKSKEIVDGKEKGKEEKKKKDKKEEKKKKKPEADEEKEEEKKKDKKEKKKKDKKCSKSGEGTEAEDTEKEEKRKNKKDKRKKEKKHMDKTDEEKGGGDDSKEDEDETEGCPGVISREVTVEEDLGKSEGEAEKKKKWKHKEGKEKKEKDEKDKGEKKKECGKYKYKDIGRLKYKLEKINGKIEALLEKKAFIFGEDKGGRA
ncbi:hypothetical protein NL676_001474 [Syzygium grande]|nr:hypothetical protein NL676_001474 [Syzygium grande]